MIYNITRNITSSYLFDVSRTGGAGGLSSSSDMLSLLLSLCCQSSLRCCVSIVFFKDLFNIINSYFSGFSYYIIWILKDYGFESQYTETLCWQKHQVVCWKHKILRSIHFCSWKKEVTSLNLTNVKTMFEIPALYHEHG